MDDNAIRLREAMLEETVAEKLPDFVRVVMAAKHGDKLVLHQDAFAGDYQEDEYRLLGMAIKFAGLHGRELHIIGRNRETAKVAG